MNSPNKFNIAYIKLCTETEGPFKRCCIWFQGCNLNCKGCCNPDLQPLTPNHIVTQKELIEIVKGAIEQFGIEGITLSGGEPSLQKGLRDFNNEIHNLGLGVIMFSGKERNQLDSGLVSSVDLLIDGPYIQDKKDEQRILIGSVNKTLSFISDRYLNAKDYFVQSTSYEEVIAEDYIFINGD